MMAKKREEGEKRGRKMMRRYRRSVRLCGLSRVRQSPSVRKLVGAGPHLLEEVGAAEVGVSRWC